MKTKTTILFLFTFLLITQTIFAKSGSSSGTPGVDPSPSLKERIDKIKSKFPKISSQGIFETDMFCCTALERYMSNEVEIENVNVACHEDWSEDSTMDIVVMMVEYMSCMEMDTAQTIIDNI